MNKFLIDELIICSLNVRGLSNKLKGRETLRWLRMKKFGIFFLQEVHCTKEKERLWFSEWGFSTIFSRVSSSSAGVCILFNNNFQFQIKKQFSDPDGRFILVDLKLENKTITLRNIYAPNDDNPNLFKNVLSHLLSFEYEHIIPGGDYNLVLDVQNDKRGGRLTTHKNSLKEVQNIINSLDLIDIWRICNPDIRRFTWRKSKPEIHCRLDFFSTSNSLSSVITKVDILPGYKTDHSLITLHLANNTNPRGPGFWKLNTSFLSDSEYINLIKTTITEVANEYQNNTEVDAVLLQDTMKMQIRSKSIQYAKHKRGKMKLTETNLESVITSLQRKLEENDLSETNKTTTYNELEVKNLQLENVVQHQTQGAMIRSKARWHNEGEKKNEILLKLGKKAF